MESQTIPEEVHLVVGGYHYYVDSDDLLRHPDSYFAHMLKDEWNKDKSATVTIDRNGRVFRYISYYLFSGYMDPNRKPIYDLDVLLALHAEADFYGLTELTKMCNFRIKSNIDRMISRQNNLGLRSLCVQASNERSTDALITAMENFRPATVATSRLETYPSDCLDRYYSSVSELVKRQRPCMYLSQGEGIKYRKYYDVSEDVFSSETRDKLHEAFSTWPLKMLRGVSSVSIDRAQVYIYESEGSESRGTPLGYGQYIGTFLYIFNSEHTGGRVTTRVNGEEVSIEKPGECMALLPGCSYSVETVTSGYLVLFEYNVRFTFSSEYDDGDCGDDTADIGEDNSKSSLNTDSDIVVNNEGDSGEPAPLVWQVHGNFSTEITAERSAALTQAINIALQTYAGVVICLGTYYTASPSSNTARRCETDLTMLKGFDAQLLRHLSNFYEVDAVTVAVNTDKENGGTTARVLDFPQDADMRLKVVAPMRSVCLDQSCNKMLLLTGLLCFLRS
eukprot:gene17125-19524_t